MLRNAKDLTNAFQSLSINRIYGTKREPIVYLHSIWWTLARYLYLYFIHSFISFCCIFFLLSTLYFCYLPISILSSAEINLLQSQEDWEIEKRDNARISKLPELFSNLMRAGFEQLEGVTLLDKVTHDNISFLSNHLNNNIIITYYWYANRL